jgi:perosamine synthetase
VATEPLAIEGGNAVRSITLPYSRQWIDETDVAAVVATLKSDWLTTGPKVREFEEAFARFVGAKEAVAVSSGTAALHSAMHALGVGEDDEVIVPALTFAASANCVVYQRATPVFADVDPETLLIDPADVARKVTARTRAVIAVDYAGQPCDYDRLRDAINGRGIAVVADACHSLGASYKTYSVGTLADMTVFSLHPVKALTTGEGGVIATNNPEIARKIRRFRNHGVTSDHFERERQQSWRYEMTELGYNYRLSDLQCALGLSQLRRVGDFVARRRAVARRYDEAFSTRIEFEPLRVGSNVEHAYHLYVIRLQPEFLSVDRDQIFRALRAEGIGVNVHYVPVYLHPFYQARFGGNPGCCPVAAASYDRILSLPLFPSMQNSDVADVITAVAKVINAYAVHPRLAAASGSS